MPGVSYDEDGNGLRSGRRRKLVHDLTGQKFGLLTVLRHEGYGDGHATWLCRCDCGGTKVVSTGLLRGGRRKSCGCAWHGPRHGHALRHSHRALYTLWRRVRSKGRGKCCARWRKKFEAFLEDVEAVLGEKPEGAWFCRHDTRRAFAPFNIEWMSPAEARARKRRRKRRVALECT